MTRKTVWVLPRDSSSSPCLQRARSLELFSWTAGCQHLRMDRTETVEHLGLNAQCRTAVEVCDRLEIYYANIHRKHLFWDVRFCAQFQSAKDSKKPSLRERPIKRATRAQSFTGTAVTSRSSPGQKTSTFFQPGFSRTCRNSRIIVQYRTAKSIFLRISLEAFIKTSHT